MLALKGTLDSLVKLRHGIYVSVFFLTSFRDFANKLSMAIISNSNSSLHGIDLSHNLIEDRGMNENTYLNFCRFGFWFLLL